jgi:hypothetical protein
VGPERRWLGHEALAGLLAERFGLAPTTALAQAVAYRTHWQRAGLLDADTSPALRLDRPDDPVWPAPRPRSLSTAAAGLSVADRRIGLAVTAADRQTTLRDWLAPAAGAGTVDHLLRLAGTADNWHLELDGTRRTLGTSAGDTVDCLCQGVHPCLSSQLQNCTTQGFFVPQG